MRLIERSAEPFAQAASAYAGAMLAPYCEVEAAELVVRDLGLRSLAIWRETYPGVTVKARWWSPARATAPTSCASRA